MRTSVGNAFNALIAITATSCVHAPVIAATSAYAVVSADTRALVTSHFRDDAHTERTLSRAAAGDTTEHESVVTRVEEIVANGAGGSTILRVTTGHYAGGDYYDSLLVRRADLRPVREHLAYLQRKMDKRFTYDGASVHQTNTLGDSVTVLDRHYGVPVFAFSEIEQLVRSLPYRAGYTAILPLYSEGDDAIEMDSVTVVGVQSGRWTIRFADPAIIALYGVDATTRTIMSYEVTGRKTKGKARKVYEALSR